MLGFQNCISLRAAIRDAATYLEIMDEVARIRTDVEVRTWRPEADPPRVAELAERHRLEGPVRRLGAALEAVRSGPQGRSASG